MKTYKHTIQGTEYALRIYGTVGLHIMASAIVPDESERTDKITDNGTERDIPSAKWLMALLYAAFITSNSSAQDSIDFMQFMMSFSTKEFNAACEWYYAAYAEREDLLPANAKDDTPSDDGEVKNA